jgi:ribosome-associated protein
MSSPSPAPVPDPQDIPALVQLAVDAAQEKKAEELLVLHLEPVTDFTDYFLIMSGTSDRQVQAIAEAVRRALRAAEQRPLHAEGERQAHWVLLDYGDFVVHIFDAERRAFYALDRLWGDAPDVTLEFAG